MFPPFVFSSSPLRSIFLTKSRKKRSKTTFLWYLLLPSCDLWVLLQSWLQFFITEHILRWMLKAALTFPICSLKFKTSSLILITVILLWTALLGKHPVHLNITTSRGQWVQTAGTQIQFLNIAWIRALKPHWRSGVAIWGWDKRSWGLLGVAGDHTLNVKEMFIPTPSASLLCLLISALLVKAADKHSKIPLPNDLSVGQNMMAGGKGFPTTQHLRTASARSDFSPLCLVWLTGAVLPWVRFGTRGHLQWVSILLSGAKLDFSLYQFPSSAPVAHLDSWQS